MVWTSLDTNLYFQIHRAVQRYLTSHRGKCSVVMLPPNTCEKFSLLSFVLLIYFLTARCGRAVQDELSGLKTVLDIFSIASYHHGNKATTCGKRPRLRSMSGAGDLTNTLTNIRISAGGHSGAGSYLASRKSERKVPESAQ